MAARRTKDRADKPTPWLRWIGFNATVAVASACIMGVEILSTRLVARFLGASLYTWTSAIGVVLAGISLGNYVGGRMADRLRPRPTLSALFITSALLCAAIPAVNQRLGEWPLLDGLSWPAHVFWHFVITFLLPSTLLGTMSPVVARMALDEGLGAGRTVGTIYAWGSIGSIAGTFAAGFYLVAAMGTESSILVISAVLAAAGLVYGVSWYTSGAALLLGLVLLGVHLPWTARASFAAAMGLESPDPGRTLFLEDSRYQRVRVLQIGNSLRSMQLDKLTHSRIDVDDPLDLRYEYEAIYAGITRVALEARPSDSSSSANSPGPPRSLFIGGGGYVFPRYLELLHPGSHNEVVELDPVVTRAAYAAMNVPADSAIVSVNLDGRNHVTDLLRRKRRGAAFEPFDFVYGDAITDRSVPFHLTTEEYLRQLAELMADDGVYLMNMMDTFESGRFLGAVVATCREVFPWVGVMARDIPADALNTFVVACSGRELDLSAVPADVEALFGFAVRTLSDAELQAAVERNPGGLVLTDDYAPVDHLLAAVVRNESRAGTEDFLAALALDDLYRAGRYDELISRCRARLAEDPRARDAHLWIGLALLAREDLDAAVVELQRAVELDPTRMRAHASLGLAHEARGEYEPAIAAYGSALALDPRDADTRTNLARALRSAGRDEASLAEYRRVVQEHPGFARARIELGRLLRDAGDAAGAAEQLEAAYALDPDRRGLREDLAAAWLALGRRAEAEALVGESPGAGGSAAIEVELGRAAAAAGRRGDATRHFARAVELEPANAGYRGNLGLALEEQGRQLEAVEQYRESLRLAPDNPPLVNALARMLAASADGRVRDGEAAVRRAEELARLVGTENPHVLDTLAAAYAEAGRFDEAIDAAERAVAIAELRERPDLADDLRARLGLYRTGRPYRVDGRWRSN